MKSRFLSFLIIFAMLFGMVPNVGAVTAYGMKVPEPSVDELALQAGRNIYDKYESGIEIGASSVWGGSYMSSYDCKVLLEAGVDLSKWERDGTNLKAEIETYLAGASGRNAKQLAQDYAYLSLTGDGDAPAVLTLLKDMQSTTTGAFTEGIYAIYTDAPAFDLLRESGALNDISKSGAMSYLTGLQGTDGSWGTWDWSDSSVWAGDFVSTSQIVRTLHELEPESNAITLGVDWLSDKQASSGLFVNGSWDDPFIDTVEMLKTMTLLDADWTTTSEGALAVDYLTRDALNDDGTFGTSGNLADDIWALDAYLSLGATIDSEAVIGITIDAYDSKIYEGGDTTSFTVTKYLFGGTTDTLNASDSSITWSIDEETKASINDGMLTAIDAGEVTVTATLDGMSASETIEIYSLDDLAMQAVENAYGKYEAGIDIGEPSALYGSYMSIYDCKVLLDAGLDLSKWERDGTNLKAEIEIYLAGASGRNAKQLAQDYAYLSIAGDGDAPAVLTLLKDMQSTTTGAFADNIYTDAPAFDLMREAGALNEISMNDAMDYLNGLQNPDGSWAWGGDFMSTAQSVRSVEYIDDTQASITSASAWLQTNRIGDGSYSVYFPEYTYNGTVYPGYYEDFLVDTAEMLKTMNMIDSNWKTTSEGALTVDYLLQDAPNNDGTFGSSRNLMDDIWALDAYLSLGAKLDIGLSISPLNDSVTENNTKQFSASLISLGNVENITTEVEWSVSDMSKATINASGLLTANNPGTIEVSALYNGLTDKTSLTINDYQLSVNDKVYVTVKGYGSTILSKSSVEISNGDSVLDVTKKILELKDISYTASDIYVSMIDDLAAFDHGGNSGWMVKVNGVTPNVGAGNLDAEDGDQIVWFYTSDWTEEEGSFSGGSASDEELAEEILEDEDATAEEIEDAFESLMEEEGKDSKETLVLLAKAAIKKAGETSLKMKSGEPADMGASTLEKLAKASVAQRNVMKKAFEDEEIALDKELKSRIEIEVKEDDDTASIAFEAGALRGAFDAKVDELALVTEWAELMLGADSLSEEDQDKEVIIEIKVVDTKDLPEGSNIPEGSTVIDMNLFVNGVKKTNFNGTMTVSIPFDPKSSDTDALTVYWLQDDGSLVPVGGVYNAETGMIVFETNHFSKYFVENSSVSFKDMGLAAWAEDEVSAMAGKGFINGRSQGIFDPSNDITRAEFAAIVARMLNLKTLEDYDAGFADVASADWYADAVAAVKLKGLMNGKGDALFDPNGKITRQEQAVVLTNILKKYGYTDGVANLDETFIDAASIASWAEDGAICSVHHELINGIEGRFAPNEKATRAQSAVMLYRLYVKIMK